MKHIRKVTKFSEEYGIGYSWVYQKHTRLTFVCPSCYAVRRYREGQGGLCPACRKDVMIQVPWYLSVPKKAHIKEFVDSLMAQHGEVWDRYKERRLQYKEKLLKD